VKQATVAVIGDLLLDVERYGSVRALPGDACPVIREESVRTLPGGAGNAAANASSLGSAARVYGVVGDDADGALLASLVVGHVSVVKRWVTPRKERILAGEVVLFRVDREAPIDLPGAEPDPVLGETSWTHADAVLASDYRKGTWIEERARAVVAGARGPVIADVRSDPRWWRGARVYCPTWDEACRAIGTDDPLPALRAWLPGTALALTRGAGGLLLADGATTREIPALNVRAVDPVGAGDTFAAALAVFLAEGADLERALDRAMAAAAVAVGRLGLVAVRRAELP
jgi:D-beta-D-heptose 7-phosphate kinase/D-beta-D-heptose 1-phosphate adenosyltransferase